MHWSYTNCIIYILCEAREPASSRAEPPRRARQTAEPSQARLAHAPSLTELSLAVQPMVEAAWSTAPLASPRMGEHLSCAASCA